MKPGMWAEHKRKIKQAERIQASILMSVINTNEAAPIQLPQPYLRRRMMRRLAIPGTRICTLTGGELSCRWATLQWDVKSLANLLADPKSELNI